MNYPCACCGYSTLDEEPSGTFAVCPVCYWEDDNIQNGDPTYEGGAIKKEFVQEVRAPLPEECPAHPMRVARSR